VAVQSDEFSEQSPDLSFERFPRHSVTCGAVGICCMRNKVDWAAGDLGSEDPMLRRAKPRPAVASGTCQDEH
jgi:hypothetical protein